MVQLVGSICCSLRRAVTSTVFVGRLCYRFLVSWLYYSFWWEVCATVLVGSLWYSFTVLVGRYTFFDGQCVLQFLMGSIRYQFLVGLEWYSFYCAVFGTVEGSVCGTIFGTTHYRVVNGHCSHF